MSGKLSQLLQTLYTRLMSEGASRVDASEFRDAIELALSIEELIPKKMLFDELFMERFGRYSRHDAGCTWDDGTKGDICTCGYQALVNQYFEIRQELIRLEVARLEQS
jgi:hypothetical protein